MDKQMTQGEQNLMLLQSLIPKNEKLYVWAYSPERGPVAVSCPEEERDILAQSFEILGGFEKAVAYFRDASHTRPLMIGSPIGMQWAVVRETERKHSLFFVIGPVFYSTPVESLVRRALRPFTYSRENGLWSMELFHLLPELPVMSYAIFTRYIMMVHNTLNGEQLGLEALEMGQPSAGRIQASPAGERNRNQVYLAERALLQVVRNGDINYQSILQNSIRMSPGVPVDGQDPLQQAKISIVVFTTLVSRAAMEGGLSPEVAYSLGDSYIQSVMDCRDSGELSALSQAMYHDFIYRVHHLRTNPNYSHAIQKCCDYIELSLDRKIRTSDLAALSGYTEYYLTEKFKKETGQSVSSYIRYAKVERAKMLLESTDLSVREIAGRLAFNTPNYFIQSFRDTTGYTPAQYRERIRKL